MRRVFGITFLFLIFYLLCTFYAFALNTKLHETINEYIAKNELDGFSLDDYLKNQLVITNGVDESLASTESRRVWQWIKVGGKFEDIPLWHIPYLRSVNHFHNPLTNLGFSGIWGIDFLSGESSVLWSQKSEGSQSPGGYYSWHDAREYFYTAFTANEKVTRDNTLTELFRSLGQLMHLVQDLSVPDHTRDDIHMFGYEKWMVSSAESEIQNVQINPDLDEVYVAGEEFDSSSMIFFDAVSLGNNNSLASVPVANLFDTDQYDGTNPDVTLQNDIGLSEYTNANFLSPDSSFASEFPYPALGEVVESVDNVWGTSGLVSKTYLEKLGSGEGGSGENITFLAATRWFYRYLPSNLKSLGLKFDKKVYEVYAEHLIPRAIGYSSQLMSYFFRGDIELKQDAISWPGYAIVNKSNEDMDGTFEIYYDNTSNQRIQLPVSASFTLGEIGSGTNRSSSFTFTEPTDAKESGEYILVFRGRLGAETDAVVASVFQAEQGEFMVVFDDAGITKYAYLNETQLENGEFVPSYNYPSGIYTPSSLYPVLSSVKSYLHRGKKIYIGKIESSNGIACPPYATCPDGFSRHLFLYDPELNQFFKFPVDVWGGAQYTISNDYIYLYIAGGTYGYKVVYYEQGLGMVTVMEEAFSSNVLLLDSDGLLYYSGSRVWDGSHSWVPVYTEDIWTNQSTETALKTLDSFGSSANNYICPNQRRGDYYNNVTYGKFYPVTVLGENNLLYSWVNFGYDNQTTFSCVGACDSQGYCPTEDSSIDLREFYLANNYYSSIEIHWANYRTTCIGRDLVFDRTNYFDLPYPSDYQILTYPFAIEDINNTYVMFFEAIASAYEEGNCSTDFLTNENKQFEVHLKTPVEDLTSIIVASGYPTYSMNQITGFFLEDQYRYNPVRIHGAYTEFEMAGIKTEFNVMYDINDMRIEQKIANSLGGIDPKKIIMILPAN